ncbi:uncharacterized protein LOC128550422 [Mercenaria mercenaria]|uniref:uncharacterized protein LOC128550422 n=1 Tax=Mercenaria mercenaria TaxID=6596 RepID=UPI00234EBAA3|nr:uncharacterized protein LOC128550422 [Mercenaria mercenaria]
MVSMNRLLKGSWFKTTVSMDRLLKGSWFKTKVSMDRLLKGSWFKTTVSMDRLLKGSWFKTTVSMGRLLKGSWFKTMVSMGRLLKGSCVIFQDHGINGQITERKLGYKDYKLWNLHADQQFNTWRKLYYIFCLKLEIFCAVTITC